MSASQPAHTDRRRAESFGATADMYDRCRPRYPQALVTDVVAGAGVRVLDVGAGTGIASAQLQQAGADVLAVEPDERMADVAAAKGIRVERATFEDWQPAGRQFDLVVLQSLDAGRGRTGGDAVAAGPRIGTAGVHARNDALAVVYTPTR